MVCRSSRVGSSFGRSSSLRGRPRLRGGAALSGGDGSRRSCRSSPSWPASRAPRFRWRRAQSRRGCAPRVCARSAPRASCRADRPVQTPRKRGKTWLPKELASVAPNRGCDAATCRRRGARSRRSWWERRASPWRRKPSRGRGDPRAGGRGHGAARERKPRGRSRRGW